MKVECIPHAFQMSSTRKGQAATLGQITLQVKILQQQFRDRVESGLSGFVGSFLTF